ncbi:hypothetical protein ACFX2K_029149 [Malus domestica]
MLLNTALGCRILYRARGIPAVSGRNQGMKPSRLILTRLGVRVQCVWGWVGWVVILLDCFKLLVAPASDSVIVQLPRKLLPSGMPYWPVLTTDLMISSSNLIQK